MTSAGRRAAILLLPALGLVACTTPARVRETATVTAANVSIVSTSLRKFARDSEMIADERQAILRELDGRVSAARKELSFKLAAMEKAGERDKLALFGELDKILEDLARLAREAETREAALAKRLAEGRSPLAPPINPLTATAGRLADLGRADEVGDNLKFLGRFIGEVVKDVKDAEKTHGEARSASETGLKAFVAGQINAFGADKDDLKPKP
jgi:hypothetical protein